VGTSAGVVIPEEMLTRLTFRFVVRRLANPIKFLPDIQANIAHMHGLGIKGKLLSWGACRLRRSLSGGSRIGPQAGGWQRTQGAHWQRRETSVALCKEIKGKAPDHKTAESWFL